MNPTHKWYGKNICCMGDSLTQAGIWTERLRKNLGCIPYLHCKGGLKMKEIVDGGMGAEGILEPISSVALKTMDLIVFFAGYNDREKTNIESTLQYCIDMIYDRLEEAENLTCKILIVTPHCVGKYSYIDADGYEEYPTGTGRTLKRITETMEKVAENNSLPVCNLWKSSGINRRNWSVYGAVSGEDAVHCSIKGYELIGDVITGAIIKSFGY
jgi:lysophospholipase L1-like esterase